MYFFKMCPRCKGDLFEDADQYGPHRFCVQCGYILDLVEEQLPQEEREKVTAGKHLAMFR